MRLALTFVIVAGCAHLPPTVIPTPVEIRSGQLDAMNFVWHTAYGMPGDPPPIDWVDGEKCGNIPIPVIAVQTPSGVLCTEGLYRAGRVTLIRSRPVNDCHLPHEYLHAALEHRTGNLDAGHTRPEWATIPDVDRRLKQTVH